MKYTSIWYYSAFQTLSPRPSIHGAKALKQCLVYSDRTRQRQNDGVSIV